MKEPSDEKRKSKYADVLIIGAGIAGLSAGIKLAERFPGKKIVILSKDKPGESNTRYAQGGIAVVMDKLTDSFEQHIQDTLKAGDGLGDRNVIETVVKEGPDRLKEVIAWGAHFDSKPSGTLALGLEGGHSANRIVHAKDETGFHVVTSMLSKINALLNVEFIWNALAIDLVMSGNGVNKRCVGVTYMSSTSEDVYTLPAPVTVLATGGLGQIYPLTTNPKIATGDGIAMAFRAGAEIADMQFIQFHPTALNLPQTDTAFLISEALRGFGAYVCTEDGNRFLFEYDVRGELAPRDSVARAIYEVSQRQQVFMDCRHLASDSLIQHFPNIFHTCRAKGIDISTQLIPVAPAAHYLCGGIVTDLDAKTSIENLYAIGECARTGLHGANRLASNSLLEALVFAHRCFLDIEKRILLCIHEEPVYTEQEFDGPTPPHNLMKAIQEKTKKVVSRSAGIIRTFNGLLMGKQEMEELSSEVNFVFEKSRPTWLLCETRNLLIAGQLIIEHSLHQHENKGTFYNQDLVGKTFPVKAKSPMM